jgi:hypothetical protein
MAVAELDEAVEDMMAISMKEAIQAKLNAFDNAVAKHPDIEIDGEEDGMVKVLNHELKTAYNVPLKTIMLNPVRDLVTALAEGVFDTRLHSISRIVGYYSRINNWNSSKISELEARTKGNYFEGNRRDADGRTAEVLSHL